MVHTRVFRKIKAVRRSAPGVVVFWNHFRWANFFLLNLSTLLNRVRARVRAREKARDRAWARDRARF